MLANECRNTSLQNVNIFVIGYQGNPWKMRQRLKRKEETYFKRNHYLIKTFDIQIENENVHNFKLLFMMQFILSIRL